MSKWREGWKQLVFQQRPKRQSILPFLLALSHFFGWGPWKLSVFQVLCHRMRISCWAHMLIRCSAATAAPPKPRGVTYSGDTLEGHQTYRDVRSGEGDWSNRRFSASAWYLINLTLFWSYLHLQSHKSVLRQEEGWGKEFSVPKIPRELLEWVESSDIL